MVKEIINRERNKQNSIIFGISESVDAETYVSELINNLQINYPKKVFRIGKISQKDRPIKVIINNRDDNFNFYKSFIQFSKTANLVNQKSRHDIEDQNSTNVDLETNIVKEGNDSEINENINIKQRIFISKDLTKCQQEQYKQTKIKFTALPDKDRKKKRIVLRYGQFQIVDFLGKQKVSN